MAFVVFSPSALTRSKVRAINGRTLFIGFSTTVLFALIGAGVLGYKLGIERATVVAALSEAGFEVETSVDDEVDGELEAKPLIVVTTAAEAPDGRFVIDQIGELSGRLFRLESEAQTLAQRIGVIKKFEKRVKKAVPAKGTTDAAGSTGGPMIPPVGTRASGVSFSAPIEVSTPEAALAVLESELAKIDDLLTSADDAASRRKLAHMLFPSRTPVKAERRSSSYGDRYDPFTGRRAFHSGMDFSAPTGTIIVASAGGRVIQAGYHPEYGNKIAIDHGNGIVSRYAHASKLFVKKGDIVNPGQKIAAVGSTGRSTGPHLHFEILENKKFVNPAHYLARGS